MVNESMSHLTHPGLSSNMEDDIEILIEWSQGIDPEMPDLISTDDRWQPSEDANETLLKKDGYGCGDVTIFSLQHVSSSSSMPGGKRHSPLIHTDSSSRSSAWIPMNGTRVIDLERLQTVDLTCLESSPPDRYIYEDYEDSGEGDNVLIDAATAAMEAVAPKTDMESPIVIDLTGDATSDSDLSVVQPRTLARCILKGEESKKVNTTVTIQQLSLAQQLEFHEPISWPQVVGKGVYDDPLLLDDFIATPTLKKLLECNVYPSDVLWAAFLKNNQFHLDHSAAADIMALWLDASPHRSKHITTLVFDDVLHHPLVRRQVAVPHRQSIYRPFKLIAKCSNLQGLVFRLDLEHLPGFENYSRQQSTPTFNIYIMASALAERFNMPRLMEVLPKPVKTLGIHLHVDHTLAKRNSSQLDVLAKEVGGYFRQIERAHCRTASGQARMNIDVQWIDS